MITQTTLEDRIKKLGTLLKKTRKEQGLTQDQLAAICGVGTRFIREVEAGKTTSQIGKVFHVITMLGLDIMIAEQRV